MSNELQTIPDLTADLVRRIVTYTDEVSYFGENSASLALATAAAQQTALHGESRYRALLRRHTLMGASGDALDAVLEEHGVPRLGAGRSSLLCILQPWTAEVEGITDARLEVLATDPGRTKFEVGDSVRVVGYGTSSVRSDVATILGITEGTGPNGGDEFDMGFLAQFTAPTADDRIVVVLRKTVAAGTVFTSSAGVSFQSLEDVTVGDSNPVMAGESAALSLADKVWCEAVLPGAAGDVEALTVNGFETPDPQVRAVFNPFRGLGGSPTETDYAAKYRAAHQGELAAVETQAQLEAMARAANATVLRAFVSDSDTINTIRLVVLTRSGAGLGANARAAVAAFVAARTRSEIEVVNLVPTAVEVSAEVTLDPGVGTTYERLVSAWGAAATNLATFLDWRKWPAEQSVDEADLLIQVKAAAGIATVVTSTFQPAAETVVAATSIPMIVRLTLVDQPSGTTFGAVLSTSY